MTASVPALFRYHGRSMWPCFQEGDILEVEAVDLPEIGVGDCVVWEDEPGRYVAHRVVGTREGLLTRGDAMPVEDRRGEQPPRIIGRVVRRWRLGRKSTVAGGTAGRLAGFSYRYAGRIDPARDARGGQLARVIRAMAVPLLKPLVNCHVVSSEGGEEQTLWSFAGKPVAVQPVGDKEWLPPWPWRLVLDCGRT